MRINKTLISPQHGQHRYTLRCRERKIVTRPVLIDAILHPGQVAAIREFSLQQRREDLLVHLSLQLQRFRPFALPAFLHAAGDVVIVFLCVVVTGTARRFNLAETEHQKFPPISISSCSLRLWLILTSSRRCISRCVCSPASQAS